jgi:hypothetical protein
MRRLGYRRRLIALPVGVYFLYHAKVNQVEICTCESRLHLSRCGDRVIAL